MTLGISFAPKLIGGYQFKKVEFKRICLKQGNASFLHKNVVNLFIYFTLGNCLFGAVKLTKMMVLINIDIVVMVLDLMCVHNFRSQAVIGVKILLFLVLI